jgi:uncharacterized cofD-like protein
MSVDQHADDLLPLRVVALGGGHGLSASLSALRLVASDLTAVVTVADDGGSSGRLRAELPILPPGDLRMALSALAGERDQPGSYGGAAGAGTTRAPGGDWTTAFQHRIGGAGSLAGHPVGNLLLAGLMDHLRDPVAALDLAGRLLGARGRVLPMSCEPLRLTADVRTPDGRRFSIVGQHEVASTPGQVERVGLAPTNAPACPQALQAIADADVIVLGPGSWYSSVLPHLLLPQLREALSATAARIVVTLNLVPQEGETDGWAPEEHLRVLRDYAPALRVATVLAEARAVPDVAALEGAVAEFGASLVMAAVAESSDPARHDPVLLARAYRTLFMSAGPLAPTMRASAKGELWP